MPGSDPQTGDVYYYPYIWKRQQAGLGESEKDRPCCVALRLQGGEFRGANVFLLALSQSGVPKDGYGTVVPAELIAKLRHLDATVTTYLVTSEFNSDDATRPNFEECEYLGALPMSFLGPVLKEMVHHLRSGAGEVTRVNE